MAFLCVCVPGVSASSYKDTSLTGSGHHPCDLINQSNKALSPNPVILGIRASACELWLGGHSSVHAPHGTVLVCDVRAGRAARVQVSVPLFFLLQREEGLCAQEAQVPEAECEVPCDPVLSPHVSSPSVLSSWPAHVCGGGLREGCLHLAPGSRMCIRPSTCSHITQMWWLRSLGNFCMQLFHPTFLGVPRLPCNKWGDI